MRILHVITSLHTGGAEKLMVDLLPCLKTNGHEVDLLLLDGTATPFRHAAEQAGIKIVDLGIDGSVYSLIKLFKLLPYLRKYDVVHTHNTASQLFVAICSLFCSAVLCTTEHNTTNRRRAWKWYAPIDRWMYNRYRNVVCISQKTEENLRRFIGKSNAEIITIHNGINVEGYSSATPSSDLERMAPNSRKLIMVAGFRPQKDQDTVIRAVSVLPSGFHLFLVGEGSRRKECEELARHLGVEQRVHFMGQRFDVAELIQASDYVVMSSHWEGFGLAAVEGMAASKPTLVSDVDGLREVVGDAGIIFPVGDADTLASKILNIDNNPSEYASVSVRCRNRALDFDIAKMADAYTSLYNSIKR